MRSDAVPAAGSAVSSLTIVRAHDAAALVGNEHVVGVAATLGASVASALWCRVVDLQDRAADGDSGVAADGVDRRRGDDRAAVGEQIDRGESASR